MIVNEPPNKNSIRTRSISKCNLFSLLLVRILFLFGGSFTIINYFLRITKDQRKKAAAFPRAIVTRPSVKSKSVASCSGYEIVKSDVTFILPDSARLSVRSCFY